MLAELIDPAILGFILIGVMLFSIFVGFPISFTLIFLGFVFGYLGFGKLVFYLMTLQFSMVMTEQTLAAVPLFVFDFVRPPFILPIFAKALPKSMKRSLL